MRVVLPASTLKRVRLTWTGKRFEARQSYEDRWVPKKLGFCWDPFSKCWWTDNKRKAVHLIGCADPPTQEYLKFLFTS